jgi:hypothetical protein
MPRSAAPPRAVVLLAVLALAGCASTARSAAAPRGRVGPTSAPEPRQTASGDGKLVMLDLRHDRREAEAALRAAGFTRRSRSTGSCSSAGVTKQLDGSTAVATRGQLADRRAIINVNVSTGRRIGAGPRARTTRKVRGMTIADAKAYLKSLGHDGEVAIWAQPVFSESCGVQKVCGATPEGGTGIHDRVTLVINPSSDVDISLPP